MKPGLIKTRKKDLKDQGHCSLRVLNLLYSGKTDFPCLLKSLHITPKHVPQFPNLHDLQGQVISFCFSASHSRQYYKWMSKWIYPLVSVSPFFSRNQSILSCWTDPLWITFFRIRDMFCVQPGTNKSPLLFPCLGWGSRWKSLLNSQINYMNNGKGGKH